MHEECGKTGLELSPLDKLYILSLEYCTMTLLSDLIEERTPYNYK